VKLIQFLLPSLAVCAISFATIGCQPPAETDADVSTSTDVATEPADSNTTTGTETP
jgi:hypothetical protein